jgi:hypothetical protein
VALVDGKEAVNDQTYLAVLPVIWQPTAVACVESILAPTSSFGLAGDEVLVVDNSRDNFTARHPVFDDVCVYRDPHGHNLGVARSWNVGAEVVLEREVDWLVIVSASMQFGYRLHTTFRAEIEANADAPIVEAMGHSWHCIAIARRTLEHVGLFDPNFAPAYWEATDYGCRLRLLGYEQRGWPRVWFNALSAGQAIHVDKSRWNAPSCPAAPLVEYYQRKWGAMSPSEEYAHPFNDPSLPLDWFEEVPLPDLAARYGWGRRGEDWW